MLYSRQIETPLGTMFAIANNEALLVLDFVEGKNFLKHKNQFQNITEQSNLVLEQTEQELIKYFKGELKEFSIPIKFTGTDFQQEVWKEIQKIPYGTTISYAKEAANLHVPRSVRAVANANGQNKISIIVPCHRIIGTDGSLTGYASGVERKKCLLELENITLSQA
ncbi:MAG: methylated-DNA--[protein]-cysteine S-methyltransferase [Prevotellaceae bacterium]|jgi:O-6-methylguanine DNA methyltransferase|nr:methylated-DNA--[protein]-cysteine S-methyltransferase [Prevotellaceae bacterium]